MHGPAVCYNVTRNFMQKLVLSLFPQFLNSCYAFYKLEIKTLTLLNFIRDIRTKNMSPQNCSDINFLVPTNRLKIPSTEDCAKDGGPGKV